MDNHRKNQRSRMLKSAKIVVSPKAPKIECAVRNISADGACLEFSTTFGIPPNFEFLLGGTRRDCRVVWRTDTRLGVAFQSNG